MIGAGTKIPTNDQKYVKYVLNQHSKAIVYLCPPKFLFMSIFCFRFSFMCQLLSYTNSVNIYIYNCSSASTPMANHLDSLHGIFGGRCGFHISNVRFALIWGWAFQVSLSPTSPAKSQASNMLYNLVGFLFSRFADRENNPVALGNQQGGPKFINPPVGLHDIFPKVSFGFIWIHLVQSGAPKIAKLVYNSNNYGLWYL